MLTLHAGDDVAYYLNAAGSGGADYYLSSCADAKEPPGFWTGKGAQALGLAGDVDGRVMRALYHHNVLPDGTPMDVPGGRRRYQPAGPATLDERIQARIAERLAELGHEPLPEEVREITLEEKAKHRNSVAFFDLTLSLAKSVSLVHASLIAAARKAAEGGDEGEAARCKQKADAVEDALRDGARQVVRSLEHSAAFVRTGHHGEGQGEWRDAAGLTAAVFVQHTNREGEPQLHAHVVVMNRAQREDGADGRWRTLDSRSLHRERLGVAADANMVVAQRLMRLRYRLVKREDGNGFEIGGVEPATMRAFSARRVQQITPAVKALVDEYVAKYGKEPSLRALWGLKQQATIESRRSKHEIERTPAESLAAWEARTTAEEVQALDDVHRAVGAYSTEHDAPPAALSEAERHRAIRIAVSEVQRHHAAWTVAQLKWELWRALPFLPGGGGDGAGDGAPLGPDKPPALLGGMLAETVQGRVPGAEVVRLAPAADVTDVSVLGVRASDGASVYRPPGEARYCTIEQLDTEEWLIQSARAKVAQLVSDEDAERAAGKLDGSQREVLQGLLTTKTATTVLVGPAGSGKTHVMARFAAAWAALTSNRVIGLTTATNAARQLAIEGLAESYNIAVFLGKIKDSDETRGNIPVGAGDVLVVDEASQVGTADLAAIQVIATQAGARIILTGDHAQLSAVEAGGIMREIARRQGHWELDEIRRFREKWEARASLRLRAGDVKAWLDYRTHGRVYSGAKDQVYANAVRLWVADFSRGKESLLLAGSNAEAAELARLARQELVTWHIIPGTDDITLSDGNTAGTGDLVRARLNVKIDAGGRELTNRDTLRITGWTGEGETRAAIAERKTPEGWSVPCEVPAAYLEDFAELAYAGNVFVAQSRTVQTGHLIVSETLTRESLYVGMTRGQEENLAHVVTAPATRPGVEAPEHTPPEAVLAATMKREAMEPSATETLRAAQEWPENTRHLFELWRAATRRVAFPSYDEGLKARLPEAEYERYLTDPQRPVLQQQLRAAELAGHDVAEILDQVTETGFEGARSVAAVLHGRVVRLGLAEGGETRTWAERSPSHLRPEWPGGELPPAEAQRESWDTAIRELIDGLDARQRELGMAAAERPPAWAVRHLGMPPMEECLLRDDWIARAGVAASYREAANINDPEQATGPFPAQNPELAEVWKASMRVLEMQEEERVQAMPQRDLEARVREYGLALGQAPRDVADDLEATRLAQRDTQAQAEQARRDENEVIAASADELGGQLAERNAELSVVQAARDEWTEATADTREQAHKAAAELDRRGVILDTEERQAAPEPTQEREGREPMQWERPDPGPGQQFRSPDLQAAWQIAQDMRADREREAEAERLADEQARQAEAEAQAAQVDERIAEANAGIERANQAITAREVAQAEAEREDMERWAVEQSRERAGAWREPEISQPEAEAEAELEREL